MAAQVVTVMFLRKKNPGCEGILVFDDLNTAYLSTCSDIQHYTGTWGPSLVLETKLINEYIATGRFQDAIDDFNVFSQDVRISLKVSYVHDITGINIPKGYSGVIPKQTKQVSQAYKAISPGASCRKCPITSEYAYADKPDGTYLCRSCKGMMDIFGGSDDSKA